MMSIINLLLVIGSVFAEKEFCTFPYVATHYVDCSITDDTRCRGKAYYYVCSIPESITKEYICPNGYRMEIGRFSYSCVSQCSIDCYEKDLEEVEKAKSASTMDLLLNSFSGFSLRGCRAQCERANSATVCRSSLNINGKLIFFAIERFANDALSFYCSIGDEAVLKPCSYSFDEQETNGSTTYCYKKK